MPDTSTATFTFEPPVKTGEDTLRPTRLCVIDVGTNSFHAIIADAYPNGVFETVDRLKEMVKLGEGIVEHRITPEAMQRGVDALRRIKQLAVGWGVAEFVAGATSAVREARNGGTFIDEVQRQTGLRVDVIEGDLEAELIYRAVHRAVPFEGTALMVDIGGGSTEFILATPGEVLHKCSLKLGAARMTQEFITTDPVGKKEFRALRTYYREQLGPIYEAVREHGGTVDVLIGSSGTMENLAALFAEQEGEDGFLDRAFNAERLREVTKRLMESTQADREKMTAIDEKRVSQIVAGAILVDVLLKDLGPGTFRVSPDALREGMVLSFIETHAKRLRRMAPFTSVRRRAVYELGFRFRWERPHAEHVAALAVALFDATQPLHERGDEARELLEYGALLHDIGYAISRRKHHKHGQYLVMNAPLQGFNEHEQELLALLVRYHRKARPKAKHKVYGDLSKDDQRLVRQLAALLRLANGLDRAHLQQVTALRTKLSPKALTLSLRTRNNPELDVWGARQHRELFELVYERELRVKARRTPEQERVPAALSS